MECLQGGDAKMEQEEVKAEPDAAPSESPDGASAETKEAEEARVLHCLSSCVCVVGTIEHATWFCDVQTTFFISATSQHFRRRSLLAPDDCCSFITYAIVAVALLSETSPSA